MATKKINTDLQLTAKLLDGNGAAGTSGQILSSTGTATDWISLSEISGVDGTGTANTVAMWSDADTITNAPITISGNNAAFAGDINVTGGDITLGTDSIASNINAVGDVLVLKVDSNENTAGAPNIQFKTGANERMRITSSGNVGIGTTSPSAKLVVKGADSAADFADYGIAVFENQQTEGLSIGYDTNGNYSWLYSREVGVSSRGLRLNGSLYVASVNGNVGIGTTSPNSKTEILENSTNGEGAELRIINDGTAVGTGQTTTITLGRNFDERNIKIKSVSSANYGAKPELVITQNQNNSGTSHTEVLRIDNAGNVGIGTTSPADKLSVIGTVNASSILASNPSNVSFTEGAGATNGQIYLYPTRGNRSLSVTTQQIAAGDDIDGVAFNAFYTNTGGAVDLLFRNGGNNNLYIKANGRVGIGTINPGSELEVNGDIRLKNYGRLYLWKDNSSNYIDYNNWITSTGATQTIQNTGSGGITLKTGTSARMFINSSGNVGIGTTAPSQKAVISGPNTTPSLNTTAVSSASLLVSNSDTGYGTYFASTGGGIGLIQQRRQTSAVYYDLSLQPYGGNVGIGTTSPTKKLDVRGSMLISGSFSGTDANALVLDNTDSSGNPSIMRMIFSGEGGNEALQIGMFSSPTIKPVYFQSTQGGGWGNIVFQNYGGNVGIGTVSPSQKLEVNGGNIIISGSTPRLMFDHPSLAYSHDFLLKNVSSGQLHYRFGGGTKVYFDNHSIRFGDWDAGVGTLADTQDPRIFKVGSGSDIGSLVFATNNTNRMYISGSGNVGIGTTSPIHKLQVAGNVYVNAGTLFLDTNNFLRWGNSNQGIKAVNDSDMSFYTGGSEKVTIDASGNVGIGTTSPSYKLQVEGNAYVDSTLSVANTATSNSYIYLLSSATGESGAQIGHPMCRLWSTKRAVVQCAAPLPPRSGQRTRQARSKTPRPKYGFRRQSERHAQPQLRRIHVATMRPKMRLNANH